MHAACTLLHYQPQKHVVNIPSGRNSFFSLNISLGTLVFSTIELEAGSDSQEN